jgi:hypothetical protein
MGFDFKLPDFKIADLVPIEPISAHQTRQVVQATTEVRDSLDVLIDSSSRLERLTTALIETSRDSNKQITALNESSAKLEGLTSTLISETANVHNQVVVLTASSHNIERLTKWLIGLTFVLGILTLVLALDVGLKYVPEHLQLTGPQTPVPPPR